MQCATFVILFIYIVYIDTSIFSLTNERCFLFDLYAFLYIAINCVFLYSHISQRLTLLSILMFKILIFGQGDYCLISILSEYLQKRH